MSNIYSYLCTLVYMSELVDRARQALLDEINELKPAGATQDLTTKIRWVFTEMLTRPCGIYEALGAAGYTQPQQAWSYWFNHYPELKEPYQRIGDMAGQLMGRKTYGWKSSKFESPEQLAAHQSGLLYDPDRDVPERPSLIDFRWDYLGTPTPEHQIPAVKALDDPTNLRVFIFGPTGMGKDSLAGQYVLWEAIKREPVAWFMESENFSVRRLQRIEPYLMLPSVYKKAPKIPGGQVPTRSMIYDWGPFKWEKGMVSPEGEEVPQPKWTQHEKYFVSMEPNEADPNLWATGVGGATYGSRIQTAVLSDLWDPARSLSADVLGKQFSFVKDTLDSRLDDDGRLCLLGTMLPWGDPYERLVNEYTDGAVIIEEDRYTTRYSNGTCVVKIKAIVTDDDGTRRSYWPVKFPLHDTRTVTWKDNRVQALNNDELSVDEILELEAKRKAGEIKDMKMQIGLETRRRRDPISFRAIMMQESVAQEFGDFSTQVLDLANDEDRSFGQYDPSSVLVLGVDPAKTFGAGWWLWEVNRRAQTLALVDFGFHQNLGFDGIKQKLIVEPIVAYPSISWLVYEVNRHEHVLSDQIIVDLVTDFGVKIAEHRTTNTNRSDVGSLALLMRSKIVRFPAATRADRERLEVVRDHFRNHDMKTLSRGNRTRPGQKNHDPDDIAMAAWVGSTKARDILEKGTGPSFSGVSRAVPSRVLDKWNNYKRGNRAVVEPKHLVSAYVPGEDIATMLATGTFEGR